MLGDRRFSFCLTGLLIIVLLGLFPAAVQAAVQTDDLAWRGEYFDNPNLAGGPVLVRSDANIDFNWDWGAPAPNFPSDNFSVRWTRAVSLPAGNYRFYVTADDGVRLFVDGQLIVDRWVISAPATYNATIVLGTGEHNVRMEYFEASQGAVARLTWDQLTSSQPPTPTPSPMTNAWRGEYFSNPALSGAPVLVRNDADIRFDWGAGSPASNLSSDGFSVRWTRSLNFTTGGLHEFSVRADDGMRLWLDGALIIDQWHDGAAQTYRRQVQVKTGVRTLRLEYYERSGVALADLRWARVDVPTVANLITCMYPDNSWIKVFRREANGSWTDLNERGWGPLNRTGVIKLDGLHVDPSYGPAGHPYRVEMWASGNRVQSVGNTAAGEPEFRLRAGVDNRTPWGCPNANLKRGYSQWE